MLCFVYLYQIIFSPWVGNNCRYYPTCSEYSKQSFIKHGFLKGFFLTISRICACQPFSKRKWTDPVPEQFAWREMLRYNRNKDN